MLVVQNVGGRIQHLLTDMPLTDAEDKSSKKQLKTERNAAMEALEKMDIS